MKWYFWIIFVVTAMLAGYFIHPVLQPCETVMPPEGITTITHGPVKPDTVFVDHYVKEQVPVYVTMWKEKEIQTIVIDTIYVEKDVPVFRSMDFFYEPYYTSEVWAWAKAPVDSFYNRVTIDYNKYFHGVYAGKVAQEANKYQWYDRAAGFAFGIAATVITYSLVK